MAIDTLKVARRLREAGFSEVQADAVVAAIQEGTGAAEFATKADLAILAAELRAEMREMEQRLIARITGDIASLKSDLEWRMFQMILSAAVVNLVAMLGVMFAFAKLLGH